LTSAMTAGPCFAKSSCRARMNFSLSLLRLPIGRPLGLPDWPGCHCGAAGFGRAIAVYLVLPYGTLVQIAERSMNVKELARQLHLRSRDRAAEARESSQRRCPSSTETNPSAHRRGISRHRQERLSALPPKRTSDLQRFIAQ